MQIVQRNTISKNQIQSVPIDVSGARYMLDEIERVHDAQTFLGCAVR